MPRKFLVVSCADDPQALTLVTEPRVPDLAHASAWRPAPSAGSCSWRPPIMPEGFSGLDFYYILPELILTGGALLLLMTEVLGPRHRQGLLMWVALATVAATATSLLAFWGVDATASRGLLAIDRFAFFFKFIFLTSGWHHDP